MNLTLFWPIIKLPSKQTEAIILFVTTGGIPLALTSNYPYELWLDGIFIGDGGLRCVPGEAFIDHWPETANANKVAVRLHWISAKDSVYYRCLFKDPFFGSSNSINSVNWTCFLDESITFKAKVCSQLSCQNLVNGTVNQETLKQLPLTNITDSIMKSWSLVDSPIKRLIYQPVKPFRISKKTLQSNPSTKFDPINATDLLLYVTKDRQSNLDCVTYDLDAIALYRFEVTTINPCILCYTEVSDFNTAWNTSNRAKVHLADGIISSAKTQQSLSPFGQRGCRYVHVLYPMNSSEPIMKVWRRVYPFDLKLNNLNPDPEITIIINSCLANLIACVDGGVVDTCWRERAQWTGDLRMCAMAINKFTHNLEIVNMALRQIAQSYDPTNGMVNGCWPIKKSHYRMPMPPYHLAFCLCAVEQQCTDPVVNKVVMDSIDFWQKHYMCPDGLLRNMPGWNFTDWDFDNEETCGRDAKFQSKAHAACNTWWHELCTKLDIASGINSENFTKAFWTDHGFSLIESTKLASIHGTAVALGSTPFYDESQKEISLTLIRSSIADNSIKEHVTAYFAYFVAKALNVNEGRSSAIEFIKYYYGPIASKYGTIYEKTNGDASLAHGWSVGIAEFI